MNLWQYLLNANRDMLSRELKRVLIKRGESFFICIQLNQHAYAFLH